MWSSSQVCMLEGMSYSFAMFRCWFQPSETKGIKISMFETSKQMIQCDRTDRTTIFDRSNHVMDQQSIVTPPGFLSNLGYPLVI